MIRITAKQDGFRRCGMAHSGAPAEYPDGRFSVEELQQLKAEPMLIVDVIEGAMSPAPQPQRSKEELDKMTKAELDGYAQSALLTNLPNSMSKAEMVAKILELQDGEDLEPSIPDGVDVGALLPDDAPAQETEETEAKD